MCDTWIYLIRDNATGFCKIGRALNPRERFKTLCRQDTKLPVANDFEFIEAWRGTSFNETELHRHLRKQRVRGEWFDLEDSHISFIYRLFKSNMKLSNLTSDDEEEQEKEGVSFSLPATSNNRRNARIY